LITLYYVVVSNLGIEIKYAILIFSFITLGAIQGILEASNFGMTAFMPPKVFAAFLAGFAGSGLLMITVKVCFLTLVPNSTTEENI